MGDMDIDNLQDDIDDLKLMLDRITSLHSKREWGNSAFCEECGGEWPCPTRRIIET